MGGVLSSCVTTLLSLGSIGSMKLEIMTLVISVPIPIPIPMPRFTNGFLLDVKVIWISYLLLFTLYKFMSAYSYFPNKDIKDYM